MSKTKARNLLNFPYTLNYSEFMGEKKYTNGLQITVTVMDDYYSYFFQSLHRLKQDPP